MEWNESAFWSGLYVGQKTKRGLIYLGHWIEFRSSINEQSIGTGPRGSLRNATGMDDACQLQLSTQAAAKKPLGQGLRIAIRIRVDI